MIHWIEDHLIAAIFVFCAILITLAAWSAVVSGQQWAAYSAEHHCVAVGTKAGQSVVTSDGHVGYTSEQTIYRCDGGELVIR